MFRRKEESLFDNEFTEENESFTIQPVTSNAPAAATAAPAQSTVVAPSTASVQPITRPAVPVPPAAAPTAFRTSASVPPAPVAAQTTSPITRPAEVKSMNPISSNTNSIPNANQSSVKANNRVLTVGNDILLKGEINSCDRLVIEGKLEATLNDVHTVELAECGSFKGSANVVEAQISGLFEGDLVVTGRLVIYASGKVRGNISYGEIEIERGGELSGSIKMAGGSSASSSIPKALQKAAA